MQKLLFTLSIALCLGAVASVIVFFEFSTSKVTAQATQYPMRAVCQTNFQKPLIYGVAPDDAVNAYDGTMLKDSGSTMATIQVRWPDVVTVNRSTNPPTLTLDQTKIDAQINAVTRPGLVAVVNFTETPTEYAQYPNNSVARTLPKIDAAPAVEDKFREAVTAMVANHKDKVKYWSYWNKPNTCGASVSPQSCTPTQRSAREYVFWFKEFYDAVKAADPNAKVIFGNFIVKNNNTQYMDWIVPEVTRQNVQYDYLGLMLYDERPNAQFPLDWARAWYDKQATKKPVWVTEWGFDRDWGGGSGQSDEIISNLVADGLDKIKNADWIYAAQYNAVRDIASDSPVPPYTEGGDFGLWEMRDNVLRPRPQGQRFLDIVRSTCNPTFSRTAENTPPGGGNPPPATASACLSSSNNLSGNQLLPRQEVTITSLASRPIKTFYFTFFNANNKDSAGAPKPFCVAGNKLPGFENDGCPAGSYQLRETVSGESSVSSQGSVQSFDLLQLPNNKLRQSVWIGNTSWSRVIDYTNDITNTNTAAWVKGQTLDQVRLATSNKANEEVNAVAIWQDRQNLLHVEIWKDNIVYYNSATIQSDGVTFDWKGSWQVAVDLKANPTALPGTGSVTARSNVVVGDKLWQIYWRGNQEWRREAPLRNGLSPDFSQFADLPNKGYVLTRTLEQLGTNVSGTGSIQAIDHTMLPNGSLLEVVWRENKASQRSIPVANGQPNWNGASAYTYPNIAGNLPINENSTSAVFTYQRLAVQDKQAGANNQIPTQLQVNASFIDESNQTISTNNNCQSVINIKNTIAGDFTGDCTVDIYDYNILVQSFETNNCAVNLVGECRIDSQDIEEFKKQFAKSCS